MDRKNQRNFLSFALSLSLLLTAVISERVTRVSDELQRLQVVLDDDGLEHIQLKVTVGT